VTAAVSSNAEVSFKEKRKEALQAKAELPSKGEVPMKAEMPRKEALARKAELPTKAVLPLKAEVRLKSAVPRKAELPAKAVRPLKADVRRPKAEVKGWALLASRLNDRRSAEAEKLSERREKEPGSGVGGSRPCDGAKAPLRAKCATEGEKESERRIG
jgi:hypothetical protein